MLKFRKYYKKIQFRKAANKISFKENENLDNQKINLINNPDIRDSENQLIKNEEELIREQLKRNYEFFGNEGMIKILDSFVVVVGIGGVGR